MNDLKHLTWLNYIYIEGDPTLIKDWDSIKDFPNLYLKVEKKYFKDDILKKITDKNKWLEGKIKTH